MGHCGSARKCLKMELDKCGSVWVIVGQEGVVVRKVGSVGLLVNCGSFSELWVIVGYCGSLWVLWVF